MRNRGAFETGTRAIGVCECGESTQRESSDSPKGCLRAQKKNASLQVKGGVLIREAPPELRGEFCDRRVTDRP